MYQLMEGRLLSRRMLTLTCAAAALATAGVCAPQAAMAQTDASAASTLDEVVVTARRREESLQDVPIAITALSGEALQEKNIVKFQELVQQTPGLVLQPSSFGNAVPGFTIRSQRQYFPLMTADPSVSVYFADVVQARAEGTNQALYDLDSVQVLKGPQGTLFGRNTTGGAIIVTPKAPDEEFGGYGRATVGNYGLLSLEGAVNLPLSDRLQLRVAGKTTRRDGFYYNLFNGRRVDDEHSDNWRVSLYAMPTDNIENWLVVTGLRMEEQGTATRIVHYDPAGIFARSIPGTAAAVAAGRALPWGTVNINLPPDGTNVEAYSVSNKTEVTFGDVTIRNIFGYRDVDSAVTIDYDGLPLPGFGSVFRTASTQYSNELQVLGKALDDQLDWIVGGYWFQEEGTQVQDSTQLGVVRFTGGDIENTSKAFFAQATWRTPFLEGLAITAGARQTYDERSYTANRTTTNTGACRLVGPTGAPLNPCTYTAAKDFEKLTYTVSIDYQPVDNLLFYATHRRGYRSGGFNFSGVRVPGEFAPFNPETVNDYEVGAKTNWTFLGGPGHANIAVYRQNYSEIQRTQSVLVGNQILAQIINAAEARVDGVEVDGSWKPVPNLTISGFYAYSRPRYRNYIVQGVDLSPSRFAGAPEHLYGADVRFDVPVEGPWSELTLSANVFHQGESIYNDANYVPETRSLKPSSFLDGYTLVNARAEIKDVAGTGVDLALFGKNLLEEEYLISGVDLLTQLGFAGLQMGQPRTYGLEIGFKF